MKFMPKALAASSIMIAAFFLLTGILKASDLAAFEPTLRSWASLPRWSLPLIVVFVPTLELALGAWMIGSRTDWRPRAAAVAMLLVFIVANQVEYLTSGLVSCGCFGRSKAPDSADPWMLATRNTLMALLLAGELVVILRPRVSQ